MKPGNGSFGNNPDGYEDTPDDFADNPEEMSYLSYVYQNLIDTVSAVPSYFKWFYNNSAMNGTSLYGGVRFIGTTHLSGNPLTGRLSEVTRDKGLGVSKDILRVAEKAAEDPKGRCTYFVLNQALIMLTDPADLWQLFSVHYSKLSRAEALKYNMRDGFGAHTIFTSENGPDQQRQRKLFKNELLNEQALDRHAERMPNIIAEVMDRFRDQEVDLEQFFTAVTMDVAAKVFMGAEGSIVEHNATFSKAFFNLVSTLLDHAHVLEQVKADTLRRFAIPSDPTALETSRFELHERIREDLLRPNDAAIRSSRSILKQYAMMDQGLVEGQEDQIDLETPNLLNQESLLLLVGHDTTARLLQFTLMNLLKNPAALKQLREEILEARINVEIKERTHEEAVALHEDIDQLPYLSMVLKETLRLYPSAPILAYMVKEPIILADLTRGQPYHEAMAARDQNKDVTLQPGEMIIASPYISHRLQFEDPEEFRPERFAPGTKVEEFSYFPFGLGPRSCPGRKFAMLEAKMALVRLIQTTEFTLKHDLDYPFPVQLLGTLRAEESVPVTFTSPSP